MPCPRPEEQGFSLLSVMSLALLVSVAAFSTLTLFRHEAKTYVASAQRDRLESALDQGLEKALYQLNTSGGWNSVSTTAYFSSLAATGTAFTDLDGYQYWVKVLDGKRVQPGGGISDTAAAALTNTGDLSLNRSILVRARENRSGAELRALAIVHRSNISPIIPVGGIYTNGSLDNGGWPGSSYNSCLGMRTTQTAGCNGSVQSGGTINPSGQFCIPQVTVGPTPQPYPPVAMPLSWTVEPWPFQATLASIGSDYSAPSGNNSYSYSVTRSMKVQVRNVDLKNSDYNIITNGHQVDVYVTGSLDAGGNCAWTTRGPDPGGQPANMWFRVVGSGNVTLSGTGVYECVVEAPQSTVSMNGGGTGSFSGAVVANNFNKNGASGNFYFDECILQKYKANTYSRPPIVTVSWSQF